MSMDWIESLHGTLDKRATTQEVAAIIRDAVSGGKVQVDLHTRRLVSQAAGNYAAQSFPSFMSDDFERPVPADRQLAFVSRMFPPGPAGWDVSAEDADGLLRFTAVLGSRYSWTPDAPKDHLSAAERRQRFPGLSHRQYRKQVRSLEHLADKARRMGAHGRQRRLIQIGRSGFASIITLEQFRADPNAAMFIAYYTARRNRRRKFTLDSRENPIDYLARALLNRCAEFPASTDWVMLALCCPSPEVLQHLDDEQRGQLAGTWFRTMREVAELLRHEWDTWAGAVDRKYMIVRRGMNSSGWNELAGAYNAARTGWLNCSVAVNPMLTETVLPGKVMRLMAADLASWHRGTGGDVDPNTFAWALLPLPWDVISGRVRCPRAMVEAACAQAGLDPQASGWTGFRATGAVADITPTPELVHGVEVSDPLWAQMLRRGGVFSGPSKKHSPEAADLRWGAERAGVITGPLPTLDQMAPLDSEDPV